MDNAERSAVALRPADSERFLIHARSLHGVIAYALDRNVDEDVITARLDRVGLSEVKPDRFDGYISLNQFAQLLRELQRLTGDPTIGMSVCDYTEVGGLGPLGNVMRTAPTLNDSLKAMAHYMALYIDVAYHSFSVANDRAEFVWSYSPLLSGMDHNCDRAALLIIKSMRIFLGEHWRPLEVHLQRQRPGDTIVYRNKLAPIVHFDAPFNAVIFPTEVLTAHNPHGDAFLHEATVQLAERMLNERRVPDDLSIRVREDILLHLAESGPNVDETSRRLGFSTRGLQRRLDELNLTFQSIADDLRQGLARDLLTQSDLPMGEIAFRLGFANQANFTRAVKRWFGHPPRKIRSRTIR